MAKFLFSRFDTSQILSRPSWISMIAVGLALAVTIAAGVFAEIQNRSVHRQSARADVGEQLGLVRARLEGNINSNLQLVRGLVALIATQPDIDQEQFGRISRYLVGEHSQLRNIAGAPDLVVSLMYPMAGNEKAIGLNYRTNEQQRDAAMRAVESGQMLLAGPVNLLQGGIGFIGRFPVFIDKEDGTRDLWGLVSAVVDAERLYADSGLTDPDLPIEIAIAGADATGSTGKVFFGSEDILSENAILSEVVLPSGRWQLAAIPRGGWSDMPENAWQIRLLMIAGALLILLPIFVAGQLYDQRRVHIRELKHRQHQMEHLSQRLKLALDTSKIGIWELNLDTGELSWDARMLELYDVPEGRDATRYDVWSESLHPDDLRRAEKEYWDAIAAGGMYHSDFRVILQDGSTRWIRAIGAVHTNARGQSYILGVNWDVSSDIRLKTRLEKAKQNAEDRNRDLEDARALMEHHSLHDSLTGLPNRRYLDQHLLDPEAPRKPTALLHIDLDRFKHINDTLGHAAGDSMLIHAAGVLKEEAGKTDFVARVGGDEFVIAITEPTDELELAAQAERIIEQMRQPIPYENHQCRIGVSIGIAMADTSLKDFGRHLLVDADIALYRAKSNGRNRFEFFSDTLKLEIIRNKQVADDILTGLEHQQFLPFFQPQFCAQDLKITGVEALARWDHPKEGILTPDVFMKTADELNVVPLIDRTILEQALWQSTRWKAAGLTIPKVSVNVSAGRLNDARLMESLDGLSFEPGTLSFELLESIFLDDGNDRIATNFEHLREKGIDIEIDDFGTGYASIVSLIHLRPSRLKIDRQLILPILQSEGQRRLVASIIEIGQSLGIKVVAEGVETMEHARILRDLGCDALQGYAFAPPMPSDKLIEFVREERWRKAS
ncbi:EAL domain-containing protein [Labrenzia sp. VG12]|uniref:bifunctional diguanylate cyclase/phosphodiesterase n=1 Tax=Labrenzia sp. VG12 TaxID=2021862 RepID=UPI000B8C668E|nr:EAL domain-containing protein [Labrenzia sp. VG12]ASP36012.1 bifunctional diguanylate cyclase/phosphodiesterase [Labrenzia sp. VG12]